MRRVACWAVTAFVIANAAAQVPSTEDFARHPEISDIALSPTGDKVALAVPSADGMETQLQIVPLDGKGQTHALRFGRQMHVSDIVWTDDNRLVVSRASMEPLQARPYSEGELFATDITGKDQEMLFGYDPDQGARTGRRKDGGFAAVSQVLPMQPGIALVSFRCWDCGEEPDTALYRVDTRTGERHEVERFKKTTYFAADGNGIARIAVSSDANDNPVIQYRAKADSAWQPLPSALAGYSMTPLRFDPDNNSLYALVSDDKEPGQLYRMDLAAGTRTRLAGRSDMDIASIVYKGYSGAPTAVIYDAGKPAVDYIDKTSEWSQLHAGLMKLFAGEMVQFIQFSRDDRKVLFSVRSDQHPGAYYVLDRDSTKIQLVSELRSWIQPGQMAPTRSVEFTARDGTRLYGFYTATGTTPRPLIVMPHGGPHGPYDTWGFDDDAQFLASRGYGVLQVNFRGSGGRGQGFMESGYREWGGRIQDDIADGVHWAIDNHLVDSGKTCIYGASFGGYAALMNPIRYPDLYKCAIGYVGVYDLALMFDKGDVRGSKSGRRYLERVLGADAATLAANSPARQAARIKLPVFLAQGSIDQRVPPAQFNALVKAMRATGQPVETLVIPGEGHGFYKPENRARMYHEMEAFLGKYLGPGPGAPVGGQAAGEKARH